MKKNKLKKGIFIAIEGIDGAGKTTQVNMIKNEFQKRGFPVSIFKEPTDSKYGKLIKEIAIKGRDNIAPKDELQLFIKDRIFDCKTNILPALKRKELVILDRYFYSNMAYQGALGLNPIEIKKENEKIAVIPDLVIILDCAVKIGLSRIKHNRGDIPNHFEKEEYLEKVREIFLKMNDTNVQIIDASRSIKEVFSHIKNIIEDIISPHIVENEKNNFISLKENFKEIYNN